MIDTNVPNLSEEELKALEAQAQEDQNQISLMIFYQLLESERFREFFEKNYELRKVVDHEAKSIDFVLIEKHPNLVDDKPKIIAPDDDKPALRVSKARKMVSL